MSAYKSVQTSLVYRSITRVLFHQIRIFCLEELTNRLKSNKTKLQASKLPLCHLWDEHVPMFLCSTLKLFAIVNVSSHGASEEDFASLFLWASEYNVNTYSHRQNEANMSPNW